MQISTIAPSELLRPYVVRYLLVKNKRGDSVATNMIPRNFPAFIFTSPEMDLVGNRMGLEAKDYKPGNIYYGGLGSGPVCIEIKGNADFIVALLQPYCAGFFFKEDALHFSEECYRITDMNPEMRNLNDKLAETKNDNLKIAIIEDYFHQKIRNNVLCHYAMSATQAILNTGGCISVQELARQALTCDRNLLRKFNQHLGVTPKEFARMTRFVSFFKDALMDANKPLKAFALDYDYYDLSHLNKDFLRYTRETPQKFLLRSQPVNKFILPE